MVVVASDSGGCGYSRFDDSNVCQNLEERGWGGVFLFILYFTNNCKKNKINEKIIKKG